MKPKHLDIKPLPRPMHILIATDAWKPQINGVVRTYQRLADELKDLGCTLSFITPNDFRNVPFPAYPEIRLAIPNARRAANFIETVQPDYIHVATEGPVGRMVRRYCLRQQRAFTTSYHTKFPEYLKTLMGVPEAWTYRAMRRFHNAGVGTMVATRSLARDLETRGFQNILPWTRGVDTELFYPRDVRLFGKQEKVFLYVGRVSKEKNIEAFLSLDLPGRKVVVGGGPHLANLKQAYPDVHFAGPKSGEELARHYASADLFVFPSKTDTFGLVILEAMASGLPVAAFPVTGPIDVIKQGESGVVDDDLHKACFLAMRVNREATRQHALKFRWRRAAQCFLDNISTAHTTYATNTGAQAPDRNLVTAKPAANKSTVHDPIAKSPWRQPCLKLV